MPSQIKQIFPPANKTQLLLPSSSYHTGNFGSCGTLWKKPDGGCWQGGLIHEYLQVYHRHKQSADILPTKKQYNFFHITNIRANCWHITIVKRNNIT